MSSIRINVQNKISTLLKVMLCVTVLHSCGSSVDTIPCPQEKDVLSVITDTDGTDYKIASDGNIYKSNGNGCELYLKYFEPNFEANNYEHRADKVYIKTSEGLFPTKNTFYENFEGYSKFNDLFILAPKDTNRNWNTMTLQSPLAQTVKDYVALRSCIFKGTCTFKDNRIDIVPDPSNSTNNVLKFTAVKPDASMVTSKSSIENTIAYFAKGSELWYEAQYYFSSNLPYSIADFESQWFDQSPGPRIVFSNGALAVENKFGNKLKFRQNNPVPVPIGSWVTIKIHFVFDDKLGTIELWQNGTKILDLNNQPTLPLFNAIQTDVEVGISATSNDCIVYIDNIRLSNKPF